MKRNQLVMEISNSQLCDPYMIHLSSSGTQWILNRINMIWTDLINIQQLIYWFWLQDFSFFTNRVNIGIYVIFYSIIWKIYNLSSSSSRMKNPSDLEKSELYYFSAIFCEQKKQSAQIWWRGNSIFIQLTCTSYT